MPEFESYRTNGHATPSKPEVPPDVTTGVPRATYMDHPVEVVDKDTVRAAFLRHQAARVLEKNNQLFVAHRHEGGLYAVVQADDEQSFVLMWLMVPRGTLRKRSGKVEEGFTVSYDGREYGLTSPLVLMTETAYQAALAR